MKKAKEIAGRKCPKCGAVDKQVKAGFQQTGEQRCICKHCNYKYNLNPKGNGYSEEVRRIAIREYYSGISARGVGKIHNMSKANVLNWIKKTERGVDKSSDEV
jgi:transposase-like protein